MWSSQPATREGWSGRPGRLITCAVALMMMAAGCQPAQSTGGRRPPESDRGPQGLVTARVAGLDDFRALIAAHRGNVILVDYWATFCAPCQKQFPHTVQLEREYRGEGLKVVTVSLDDPQDQSGVLDFLRASEADFENLISEHGTGVESFREFDIPGGALPYYQLYDRQGELRFEFSSGTEGIQARIEELLAES